ncbi:MAG: hypothetical protein ACREJ3_00890, partial [Polyangiaceae bacterium]
MPDDEPRAYAASKASSRLYQREILSGVIERLVRWTGGFGDDAFGFDEIVHPYAVIVMQDCDPEQDANARVAGGADEGKRQKSMLPAMLMVVASEFDNATDLGGSDIKRRAKHNKDERYQFLSAISASDDALGYGIGSLILDFKRFFTYRTEELLRAVERGETRRRARLITPYAQQV